jgi:hypothetical protein
VSTGIILPSASALKLAREIINNRSSSYRKDENDNECNAPQTGIEEDVYILFTKVMVRVRD